MLDVKKLAKLVRKGNVSGVAAFFEGASEAQRREIADAAVELYNGNSFEAQITASLHERQPGDVGGVTADFERSVAASAALIAAATWGKVRKRGVLFGLIRHEDAILKILEQRRPKWADKFANWIVTDVGRWWSLVRRLERRDICQRPEDEEAYFRTFVGHYQWDRGEPMRQELLEDRELLEEHVWWVFRVELDRSLGLRAWIGLLAGFAAEGRLDRGRIIDAAIDALERDFHPNWARSYSKLLAQLRPTVDELADRADRLLGLLVSRAAGTVKYALQTLRQLDRAKRLDAEAVVDHLSPAMAAKAKGTVKIAMKLLESAVKRRPACARPAAMVAADGLSHPAADVSQWAMAFIEKHADAADAALAERLADELDTVPPGVRPALQAWLDQTGGEPAAADEDETDSADLNRRAEAVEAPWTELAGLPAAMAALAGASDLPARLTPTDPAIPRLDPAKRIQPIETVDELIDVCAMVVEGQCSADDLERGLDAVNRLCDQRPDDFRDRTAALRKRVAEEFFRHVDGSRPETFPPDDDARPHLLGMLLAWLDRSAYESYLHRLEQRRDDGYVLNSRYDCAATMFIAMRMGEIAWRVLASQPMPLLSAPTHSGGWIDPPVLVHRARQYQSMEMTTGLADRVQALLRLAPEHRSDALSAADTLTGEGSAALRYALGADEAVGEIVDLWVAAARARHPFEDDSELEARHPGLGPDAARLARFQLRPRTQRSSTDWRQSHPDRAVPVNPEMDRSAVPATRVTVAFHGEDFGMRPWAPYAGGTVMQIHPLGRHSLFARAIGACLLRFDTGSYVSTVYFEPLFDPDQPLGNMGPLVIAAALAVKDPSVHGLGVDAAVACIEDGRLDGRTLGEALAELVVKEDAPKPPAEPAWPRPPARLKPPRWADKLAEVARVSELHAAVVREALLAMFRPSLPLTPRDALRLIELLHGLCVDSGETVPASPAREYLAAIQGKGKAAKLARDLLDLPGAAELRHNKRRRAATIALQGRLARAERWARWARSPADADPDQAGEPADR